MDTKKILLIAVIAVFIVLEVIVVRQFVGDWRYRQGRAVLQETEEQATASGEGSLAGYERAGAYFTKALWWHDGRAEHHYWRARLCQILTHRYARREGRWDDTAGIFIDGEASRRYGLLAIEEFYRAIDRNPACQYYHLELAWLLRSKLPTVAMTAAEMLDTEGTHSRDILSVFNTWKEYERAILLAPNRTMHRMSFGDFLVERLAAAEGKAGKMIRETDALGRLLDEAVRQYREALALSPSRVGDVLQSLTGVTTDYDTIRMVLPASNRGLKKLVLFLAEQGDSDTVHAAFHRDMTAFVARYDGTRERAERLFPYYDTLAELHVQTGEYGRAGAVLESYLVYDPGNDRVHARAAGLFARDKQYEQALFHLRRALAIDGSQSTYRRQMVSVILAGQDAETAAPLFDEMARDFPGDAAVYEGLGTNYLRMGKEKEAEAAYRMILTQTGDRARGNYLLGRLYNKRGDRDRAARYLKKAAFLNAGYRHEFNRIYPLDVLLREYVTSSRDYETLKRLIPRTPEALTGLALLLYGEGAWSRNRRAFIADLKEAEERLDRLRREGKSLKDARKWLLAYGSTLAEIHEREGQPCKAIGVLRRLTSLDAENPRAWFSLARLTEKQGRSCGYGRRQAERSFERAIAGDSENVTYMKEFAGFLTTGRDLLKAEQVARRAVEQAPRDPETHAILARVYDLSGRRTQAIAEMSAAVSLSKGKQDYRDKLAELLRQ